MIHDKLPRGMHNHIRRSIEELEDSAIPVNDALDTLQQLARPLTVGLEKEYRALDRLVQEIKLRWAFFEANGGWPNGAEALTMARASAAGANKLGQGDSSGEPS